MCKSFKMRGSNRWKTKELDKLIRDDKECREAVKKCEHCGHKTGFKRNFAKNDEWICGCDCHTEERK